MGAISQVNAVVAAADSEGGKGETLCFVLPERVSGWENGISTIIIIIMHGHPHFPSLRNANVLLLLVIYRSEGE